MPQNVFPPNACVYCTGNPDPIRRRNAPASRSESESWLFLFCETTLPMIKRSHCTLSELTARPDQNNKYSNVWLGREDQSFLKSSVGKTFVTRVAKLRPTF